MSNENPNPNLPPPFTPPSAPQLCELVCQIMDARFDEFGVRLDSEEQGNFDPCIIVFLEERDIRTPFSAILKSDDIQRITKVGRPLSSKEMIDVARELSSSQPIVTVAVSAISDLITTDMILARHAIPVMSEEPQQRGTHDYEIPERFRFDSQQIRMQRVNPNNDIQEGYTPNGN